MKADEWDYLNVEVAECVPDGSYVGMIPHVIDDALEHRRQCHHGVSASAVDGLVRFL